MKNTGDYLVLLQGGLTEKEAINFCGGYTKRKTGESYGITDDINSNRVIGPSISNHWRVLCGIEYAFDKSSLDLPIFEIKEIVRRIFNGVLFPPLLWECTGGYTMSDGTIVQEKVLWINLNTTVFDKNIHWQIFVRAERLRQALRQESIIVVDTDGKVYFVKEEMK